MSTSKQSLAEELRDLARQQQEDDGELDFATLVAYHRGTLDAETSAKARRALVADPALAEALLDIDRMDALEAMVPPDAGRRPAAWQRFEERLQEPAANRLEPAVNSARELPQKPAEISQIRHLQPKKSLLAAVVIRRPLTSLAASFLLATLLSVVAIQVLQPATSGRVVLKVLDSGQNDGPLRGSISELPAFEVPETTKTLVLCMVPATRLARDGKFPSTVDFELWQGERELEVGHTLLQDNGLYCLELMARRVDAGDFRVHLRHRASGAKLATYSFNVSRPQRDGTW